MQPQASTPPPDPSSLRGILAVRDFRWLLAGTLAVGMTMPLQFISQMFWVQQHLPEQETLMSGLVAGSRGLSMLTFGLLGGALADRFERRGLLLRAQWGALVGNVAIAALMILVPFGGATVWPILALTVGTAACWTIDNAARTASLPSIVGLAQVSRAVSLVTMATQLAHPIVLPLSGFLLEVLEPGQVYLLTLGSWALILPLLHALHFRSQGQGDRRTSILGNVRQGLVYVVGQPALRLIFLLLLCVQLVGMPGVGMLGPVWMTRVLDLSPQGFGWVAMTWGLGASSASIFYALGRQSVGRINLLAFNVLLFGAATLVFGFSREVLLTAAANFVLGASLIGSTVSVSTLAQQLVREEMRGRVMGLIPLAMGLAMLGAIPFGALGQAFSLERMVPVSGGLVLASFVVVWLSGARGRAAVRDAARS